MVADDGAVDAVRARPGSRLDRPVRHNGRDRAGHDRLERSRLLRGRMEVLDPRLNPHPVAGPSQAENGHSPTFPRQVAGPVSGSDARGGLRPHGERRHPGRRIAQQVLSRLQGIDPVAVQHVHLPEGEEFLDDRFWPVGPNPHRSVDPWQAVHGGCDRVVGQYQPQVTVAGVGQPVSERLVDIPAPAAPRHDHDQAVVIREERQLPRQTEPRFERRRGHPHGNAQGDGLIVACPRWHCGPPVGVEADPAQSVCVPSGHYFFPHQRVDRCRRQPRVSTRRRCSGDSRSD